MFYDSMIKEDCVDWILCKNGNNIKNFALFTYTIYNSTKYIEILN